MDASFKTNLLNTKKSIAGIVNSLFTNNELKSCLNLTNKEVLQFLEYPLADVDTFYYERFKGMRIEQVILNMFQTANQQFCFWFDKTNPNKRGKYSSSTVNNAAAFSTSEKVYNNLKDQIITNAITLREERLTLAKEVFSIASTAELLIDINSQFPDFNNILGYLYNQPNFHFDPLRKKANFFIMDLVRYYRMVKNHPDYFKEVVESEQTYHEHFCKFMEQEILPYHMPAIDYQIPKGLRSLGLIKLPNQFEQAIEKGMTFNKDGKEELFIRCVAYLCMLELGAKFKDTSGITQAELDGNLFYQRDRFKGKIHMCITTHY